VLATDKTKFIQNFRQVVFDKPDEKDNSAMTRFSRRVLVYRALLARANFVLPPDQKPVTTRLFNKKLLKAMEESEDPNHKTAALTLRAASPSWASLANALEFLYDFMSTDGYKKFEQDYSKTKQPSESKPDASLLNTEDESFTDEEDANTGDAWADQDLKKLLEMFKYPNGARQIGKVRDQHTDKTTSDYAQDIYKDLVAGRLVIVDQSSGDPQINRASAERILWEIFREQQARFRRGEKSIPDILVFVEEAHNLLPAGTDMDLQDVWVRTAKEGAKYHIGLVYATQEVSSIQRNILKNTANWFIGHLNNTDETKELCKYYDFEDFEPSIRRAQDRGFLRVKTLSNLFVVPVQVRKFEV